MYSTDEKSIGKWIDGKTLYRKIVDTGQLPDASVKNVAHGISSIDNIIKISGTATNGSATLPLPLAGQGDIYNITLSADKTNIIIQTGNDRSAYNKSTVEILFTKL